MIAVSVLDSTIVTHPIVDFDAPLAQLVSLFLHLKDNLEEIAKTKHNALRLRYKRTMDMFTRQRNNEHVNKEMKQ